MGAKPSVPTVEATALPEFKVSQSDVIAFQQQAQQTLQDQAAKAAEAVGLASQQGISAGWASAKPIFYVLGGIIVLVGLVFLYEFIAVRFGWPTIPFFTKIDEIFKIPGLTVTNATQGGKDLTSAVTAKVGKDSLVINSTVSNTLKGLGASSVSPISTKVPIVITYQYDDESAPRILTITDDTQPVVITPDRRPDDKNTPLPTPDQSTAPAPYQSKAPTSSGGFGSTLQRLVSGGDNSGDQLPSAKDASSMSVIPSASVPSSGSSYGMQWWMYVADWDYNFGKEKPVLIRADPTNRGVMNPRVVLHPTDNSLRVSVSVFPDNASSSSKSEPAPADAPSSTDDVYNCEIPNIPLQTWFSVSLTTFGRNLDVYLNGKLVKSCLLSGVPKPAVGDIQLNTEGGFSGYMCGFYHYPRMLTPTDASTFYNAGTACSSTKKGSSAGSNYNVTFGVYNTKGKEVSQYVL